jgi:DNA-binding GntR family transcriptional regulator
MHSVTKTDLAYLQIRQQILEGTLAPETSLDQEELATGLGLSTTPVREALRRLESERLVVNRAHRDTVVAPLSAAMVEEVYAVRLSLDPLAVTLAATNASDAERERILKLSEEKPASDDPIAWIYLNRRLHQSMYAASGNNILVEMLDSLWDSTDRYRLIISKNNTITEVTQEEHSAIAAAIVDRNADRAGALMRAHLAASLQQIRAAVATQDVAGHHS